MAPAPLIGDSNGQCARSPSARPMIITADRLYAIVTDEDDVPYLVAFRIVK